jgi:OmpA-OmpF porin, OOP family
MQIRSIVGPALVASAFLAGGASDGHAQLGKLRKAAKEAAGQKAIGALVGNGASADTTAVASGAATSTTASAGDPVRDSAAAGGAAVGPAMSKPGEGAWVNYDFVPGERPLFIEDFTADAVGDFPRRITFIKGNMEVAEWQGGRYLRATSASDVALPLGEVLPERFTLEFDYAGANKYELEIRFTDSPGDFTRVLIGAWQVGVDGGGIQAITRPDDDIANRFARVRVMADGGYVKVYVDDRRVANVPNANLGRADRIWIKVPAHPGIVDQALIGGIRVMAGGRKLYDAIAGEGRAVTQGVLFDTGSDRLRPESTPTLKEIAAMLGEHADLRLRIEGHTDAVGDDAANQVLSERRAAAVVAYLVAEHDIDASRLESVGVGEAKPVAGNESAEGRQANRRVELVRL